MEFTLSNTFDEFINKDSNYRSLLRSAKALKKKYKRDKKELKQANIELDKLNKQT